MEKNIKRSFPVFLLPTLTAFVVCFVYPFLSGIYLSFTNFTTVTDAEWAGLSNYKALLTDGEFLYSLGITVLFTLITLVTVNVTAFFLALALTEKSKGTAFLRTCFFMPNLIGGIVLGYIWQLILNGILQRWSVSLTFSEKYGFLGLVIMSAWQMIGYMMVIYIAGLQGIPSDLIDAARVDGASFWARLRHVIIPNIMPSVTICLFLTITNSFQLFDGNLALTDGAPSGKTALIAMDIYKTFYGKAGQQGVGQAKAVVFFAILGALTLVQLKITGKREVES